MKNVYIYGAIRRLLPALVIVVISGRGAYITLFFNNGGL
jgi:hypothetical protein